MDTGTGCNLGVKWFVNDALPRTFCGALLCTLKSELLRTATSFTYLHPHFYALAHFNALLPAHFHALAPVHCYALLTVHFYALQPHLHICTRTFMHFLCTCSALSVHFFALRFGQFGLVLCTVTHFNALPFHSAGTHFCALLYSQGWLFELISCI